MVSLMKFIDVFGISPEMVPSGGDFNDVINFMKKNNFMEERGSLINWKNFVKVHDDIYFLLRIQRRLIDAKSYEYTYEMTVKILGIPMFFEEKDKNLRKALCNAFAKAQNWSIENGNTGSGIEQTAQDEASEKETFARPARPLRAFAYHIWSIFSACRVWKRDSLRDSCL